MRTLVLCLLGLLLCTCGPGPRSADPPPPNVLFILTDDQGIGDLSLAGNDSIRTPHLDRLLRRGVRFERFYVSPVCAPTRASFLSGQYAPRTGAIFVTRRQETMDDAVVTLPEYLKRAGYRTGLFGKWHNGATFPYHPAGQGFDEFLGFTLGHLNDYFVGELRNEHDEAVPFQGDLTGILTDSAAHFMLNSDAPFFCMLAYQAPHTPVQVADRYWDGVAARGLTDYNTGIYAMVESVDDRVGRLLDTLSEAGLLDNTLVIFASDNGPNGDRYRRGLRGTKGHVDEGGVRVPFGLLMPGADPANGRVVDTPAAHVDLLPTVLDYLGLPVPDGLDGISLLPLLRGDTLADRYVYAFGQGPVYTGYPGSMRDARYLYVARDSLSDELYDLRDDPGQQTDIYGRPGTPGRRMRESYRDVAAGIGRPDRVAPPIDLDAGEGTVRLLAHEGEPLGNTHFSDPYGWANDFFVNVDDRGAYWPVVLDSAARFAVTVRYHLDAPDPLTISVSVSEAASLTPTLPVAVTETLPVHDRVPRKEVLPRGWAVRQVGEITVPAGEHRLRISGSGGSAGSALWIKEVDLRRVEAGEG
ncbi:sulfatase-like hydrolase/transferase [Lewinella sp. IMCC34183]|uniref:sulfatase-like hydrolase/transferase n=1 Tax=Lewinella sp. IMCC34183 TaxID=2248762 RepID=UPI001300AF82|nr:sulfatase-like hydrolase/transferase [Lewinella sp. IMCC34183]